MRWASPSTQLGRDLRNRLNGIEAAEYPDGPRTATIRVELPEAELTADFLDRIRLRTAAGDYVALGDIVTVDAAVGVLDDPARERAAAGHGHRRSDEDDPARAAAVSEALDEHDPAADRGGLRRRAPRSAGSAEQESEFLADALLGFMRRRWSASTWCWPGCSRRWTRPLVVMAIIPFGLIGAIWGHVIWDVPLSMYSVVGLIGMTGIIINDSIVLVSTVDEYAAQRGLIPAIIDAVADRLRPVFLTTLTTVFGLAPLLYETLAAGAVPEADGDHAGLRPGLRDGAGAAGGAGDAGDAAGHRRGRWPRCAARSGCGVRRARSGCRRWPMRPVRRCCSG